MTGGVDGLLGYYWDGEFTYEKAAFFHTALHQAWKSQLNWSLQRERMRNLNVIHYTTANYSLDNQLPECRLWTISIYTQQNLAKLVIIEMRKFSL